MSLSLKGLIAYFRGDLAGATKDYDEAVRLSPKQASFHESRGLALAARGELGRAIQDYTQAITLPPEETSAYFARGLAYFSQGDFGLAATDFARLKDDPNDARGLLWYYQPAGAPVRRRAGRNPPEWQRSANRTRGPRRYSN